MLGLTACLCPLQTVVSLENGKLVQKQSWDGKETNIEREISDGKLVAVSICFFEFSIYLQVAYVTYVHSYVYENIKRI